MAVQEVHEEKLSEEAAFRLRLEFAERCFANAQELNRFMDTKSGYLLSAVALMTAALAIVSSKALDVPAGSSLQATIKLLGTISFLAYVVLAFAVIYSATIMFRALPNLLPRHDTAPGLIFPLMVLEHYKTDDSAGEKYLNQLLNVRPEEILHDYADQILAVSSIYQRKQRHINLSMRLFQYLSVFWVVTILLLLATIVLH